MWPSLAQYESDICIAKNTDDGNVGLVVYAHNDTLIDSESMISDGFVLSEANGKLCFLLAGQKTFKLSQLKRWFPGFSKEMLDEDAEPARTEISFSDPMNLNIIGVNPVDPEPVGVEPVDESVNANIESEEIKKQRIEDAGEKIGGAVKDYRGKGGRAGRMEMIKKALTENDVALLKDQSLRDFVSVGEQWPYSFKKAKEDGVKLSVASSIYRLRKMFVLKDIENMDSTVLLRYHNLMVLCHKYLNQEVKTPDDLMSALIEIHKSDEFMDFKKEDEGTRGISFPGRGGRVMAKNYAEICYGIEITVKNNTDGIYSPFRYSSNLDKITDEYHLATLWKKIGVRVKTEDDDDEEKMPVIPERPHLDSLENSWLPERDVTVQDFMDTFGFRAVEWGEWMPQDERQTVLNEAYGSFMALSDVTGLPRKMMSLNGSLAAGFGSRGRGGRRAALAHYEPAKKVFNLTRFKGAGSLAHEWGHALDYYLLENSKNETFKIPALTKHITTLTLSDEQIYKHLGFYDQEKFRDENNEIDIDSVFEFKMFDVVKSLRATSDLNEGVSLVAAEIEKRINYASSWFFNDFYFEGKKEIRREIAKNLFQYGEDIFDYNKNDKDAVDPVLDIKKTIIDGVAKFDTGYFKLNECITDDPFVIVDVIKDIVNQVNKLPCIKRPIKNNYGKNFDNVHGNLSSAIRTIKEMRNVEKLSLVESRFFKDAKKIDSEKKSTASKPYWSTNLEMFARAFESYVSDCIEAKGNKCDYLVNSVNEKTFSDPDKYVANPYPSGNERKVINSKMNELMNAVRISFDEKDDEKDDVKRKPRMRG